ncbi:hypothetical protein [Chitinophaga sp. HK235]|uniref:hypothetical protein n=1 Tax=Chitinophaga sp. HK235 TaxID=2952571 RepID=UPI001BA656B6|nr:hypothetical protein [Chitinophaga sp. HK235]
MTRLLPCILFIALLISACSNKSKKDEDPCGNCCYFSEPLRFRLVDARTGEDLVFGPHANISSDSIRFIYDDKQVLETRQSPWDKNVLYGPESWPRLQLEVGRPGKMTREKLTITPKSNGCCTTSIQAVTLGENPVSLTKDSAGVYLIPYSL